MGAADRARAGRSAGLLLVCLALASCTNPQTRTAPEAPLTIEPTRPAAQPRTVVQVIVSPAPSPSPAEILPLRIVASIDPPLPNVGTPFVLHLEITNSGERPAHGVYVATSGPWDRYTVSQVEPEGTFGRDAAGWHILSPVTVPAGESRTLDVHATASVPSNEQLTFAVREAEPGDFQP